MLIEGNEKNTLTPMYIGLDPHLPPRRLQNKIYINNFGAPGFHRRPYTEMLYQNMSLQETGCLDWFARIEYFLSSYHNKRR